MSGVTGKVRRIESQKGAKTGGTALILPSAVERSDGGFVVA